MKSTDAQFSKPEAEGVKWKKVSRQWNKRVQNKKGKGIHEKKC